MAGSTRWHLTSTPRELRISQDFDGKPDGVALSIGSTALSFRPRRSGSRRGETMRYHEFSHEDKALAHLLAAAPDLYEALAAIVDACDRAGKDDDLSIVDTITDEMEATARAALSKAQPTDTEGA